MRKMICWLLLLLMVLMAGTVPASASETAEIHGYAKKTGYHYVNFGTFPMDANGAEAPILWRVLEVKGEEAFLLAEYIIDVHYVHLDTKAYYDLKWEDSDLFNYLQTEFMTRAFTMEEQAALLQRTEDGGLVTLPKIDDIRNKDYGFADNKSRLCKGTDYAKSIGLYQYTDKNSPWVSRNKSQDRPQQQRRVMDDGKLGTVPCGNVDLGVRPCVHVDLSQLIIAGGSGTKDDPYQLVNPNAAAVEPTQAPAPAATEAPQAPQATETPAVQAPEATQAPAPVATEAPKAQQPAASKGFTAAANPESIHELFPELTAEGFLPEGEAEFVHKDEENGLWLYASQTLRIEINRQTGVNSKKEPLRWYEAHVYAKDESELFDLYPWNEEKYKNRFTLELADKIAKKHKLVFAINSDYFIYRVGRQAEVNYTYPIGIIIRDGEIFYDVPKNPNSTVYPPLDTMALYPDGSVTLHKNATTTAKDLIAAGAVDTLSFGPILVENGEVSPRSQEFGNTPNPRTAFGIVEPGYYICVMVESRISESKGESCVWMGQKMAELGCESAINLDGGATSTMIFMGEQINKSGNYGDITNRKQNELLGIGYSENVK